MFNWCREHRRKGAMSWALGVSRFLCKRPGVVFGDGVWACKAFQREGYRGRVKRPIHPTLKGGKGGVFPKLFVWAFVSVATTGKQLAIPALWCALGNTGTDAEN